jgi:hypothetical protein
MAAPVCSRITAYYVSSIFRLQMLDKGVYEKKLDLAGGPFEEETKITICNYS